MKMVVIVEKESYQKDTINQQLLLVSVNQKYFIKWCHERSIMQEANNTSSNITNDNDDDDNNDNDDDNMMMMINT
jgi:hypothetical protein